MLSHRFRTLSILVTALCLILSLPVFAQADKDKKDEDKDKVYTNKDAEKAEVTEKTEQVFTNEDLERLFGGASSPADPAAEPAADEQGGESKAAPAKAEDPLAWMNRRQAEGEERQKAIKEGEAHVAQLRERLSKLESSLLTARNTLLTRRVAPKKPDADSELAEGWDDLDQKQRAERVEKELEKTRKELKEAEQALARLRSGS